MLKLEKTEGGTGYYIANGPLTRRDVAILRKHHWISLMSGTCRMWWQGEHSSSFLFNNNPGRGDQRFPYDPSDITVIDRLNAAWAEFVSSQERAA